ncbi:hypothetical protein MHYP_G00051430 [Metynnis hypsauchen]
MSRFRNKSDADRLKTQDLTEEDQGDYSCSVQGDYKDVRLRVKVRETPTHLWTTDPATTPSEDPPTTAATESERIMMCVAR